MSSNWVKTIIGALLCIRLIYLGMTDQLTLYVHPRYILFTCIMSIIGLAIYIFHLRSTSQINQSKKDVAILTLVLLAISLPAQPLSSRIAQARQFDQATLQQTVQSSFDLFSRDYTHFDLQDWVVFLATQPKPDIVEGKDAVVTGFIYTDSTGTESVARFRLSCCAVDATPLSLPLYKSEAKPQLEEESWYELKGGIVFDSERGYYALDVREARLIEPPKEQYVF